MYAVSDEASPGMPSVGDFKHWKPEVQAKALDLLKEREATTWRPFYCGRTGCDGHPHGKWEFEHARSDQVPPKWSDEWLVWLLAGGRGSGKTRAGSELTHRVTEIMPRIILIAPTGPDPFRTRPCRTSSSTRERPPSS